MSIMMIFVLYGLIFLLATGSGLWFIRFEYRKNGKLSWFGTAVHFSLFIIQGFYASLWIFGPEGYNPLSLWAPAGFVLMGIGAVIIIFSMEFFQTFSRWMGNHNPGLTTNRLYRYSRNPQFVGYMILTIGAMVAWWNFLAWMGPATLIVVMYPLTLIEEEHLRSVYGEEYIEYCRQVPRYLGLRG